MKLPLYLITLLNLGILLAMAQSPSTQTWAEKLGYPENRRILILHADDIGMCYEANQAAQEYLLQGHIQSAAAMVPCPWFNEMADWYRANPSFDIGLHLALTSEWKYYRWGSVAPVTEVPGLIDPDGYLWKSVQAVAIKASGEEVETEIRAQVLRALSLGIQPSHLDTHMGTLYARLDYTKAYLKVAQEFGIPAMVIELTPKVIEKFKSQGYPMSEELPGLVKAFPFPKLDDFYSAPNGSSYNEKRDLFFQLVQGLSPGITEIIFHPSMETPGLKKITNSWQQRVWESQLFKDPLVHEFFRKENIHFTNWKEMMSRYQARYINDPSKNQP